MSSVFDKPQEILTRPWKLLFSNTSWLPSYRVRVEMDTRAVGFGLRRTPKFVENSSASRGHDVQLWFQPQNPVLPPHTEPSTPRGPIFVRFFGLLSRWSLSHLFPSSRWLIIIIMPSRLLRILTLLCHNPTIFSGIVLPTMSRSRALESRMTPPSDRHRDNCTYRL